MNCMLKHKLLDHNLFNTSIVLFLLVSFSFIVTDWVIIPLIVLITIIQFIRLKKRIITNTWFFNSYFYLLIYSSIYSGAIHKIILISLLVFFLFFKEKQKNTLELKEINNKLKPEKTITFLFILLLFNSIIFSPRLIGLDIYLYYFIIPLLFFFIKRNQERVCLLKSLRVLISSVLVTSILLVFVNLYEGTFLSELNTFFSRKLEITHVYYGMFLGVSNCFILILNLNGKRYCNKRIDIIIAALFFLILTYIGARIALIASIFVLIIFLYKKLNLSAYRKLILFLIVITFSVFLGTKSGRVQSGITQIKKVYISLKTDNKKDLIANSWRNMYQRFLVTKYTIEEIKQNYLLGIGMENVTEKISKSIQEDGFIHFKPINPHNQYLHFFLGMGVIGLLYLLYILYFYAVHQSIDSNIFLIFFTIIMLTESILVRGKGITVFTIFYLIFLSYKQKQTAK
ncbi:O-Antigen ligase [Tenacibaculum sp. 190524A02b]|uniref:O-Antigen ligase n=1 Tax=Tenacibaculum vairaonense TaxID=3137860 RepID=A0ABP1FA86_9FLAO